MMIKLMEMTMIVMMKRTTRINAEGNDDDSDGSSLLLSPDHHETAPFSCFVTFL